MYFFPSIDLASLQAKPTNGTPSKAKKKKRGVRFDEMEEKPRPGYGLLILKYMMSHSLNRAILLKKNVSQLEDLVKLVQVCFQNIIIELKSHNFEIVFTFFLPRNIYHI